VRAISLSVALTSFRELAIIQSIQSTNIQNAATTGKTKAANLKGHSFE